MTKSSGGSRGVAHAEVDHVVAGAALVVQQRVDAAEQIGRQARDTLGDLNSERRGRRRVSDGLDIGRIGLSSDERQSAASGWKA